MPLGLRTTQARVEALGAKYDDELCTCGRCLGCGKRKRVHPVGGKSRGSGPGLVVVGDGCREAKHRKQRQRKVE